MSIYAITAVLILISSSLLNPIVSTSNPIDLTQFIISPQVNPVEGNLCEEIGKEVDISVISDGEDLCNPKVMAKG